MGDLNATFPLLTREECQRLYMEEDASWSSMLTAFIEAQRARTLRDVAAWLDERADDIPPWRTEDQALGHAERIALLLAARKLRAMAEANDAGQEAGQ